MDSRTLAEKIVEYAGSAENVSRVAHCMTRLRITPRDESKVDEAAISKLEGVFKVLKVGGQYQIVLGGVVDDVFDAVTELCADTATVESDVIDENLDDGLIPQSGQKRSGVIGTLIDTVSGIVAPVLSALLGCGMVQVVSVILQQVFHVPADNTTVLILNAVSDTLYGFFPIIIGWSAAKRFGANTAVALVMCSILVSPNFTGIFESHEVVTFAGIPVTNVYYGSSILPAIISVYLLSKLEKLLRRLLPAALRAIFVPFLCLLVCVPSLITVIGPIGAWGGDLFAGIFTGLYAINPILAGAVIGGTWQILIIFGMHIAILGLVSTPNIAMYGRDTVIMTHAPSLMCQVAAGLAVALKAKDKAIKRNAFSLAVTSFFAGSVIEPVMYGVNLKYKKPFLAVCIGGAVGGAITGAFHAGTTAAVALSLYTIPVYLGEGFGGLMLGCAVGALVTFALTWIMGIDESIGKEN